jgi:hypothetical protein
MTCITSRQAVEPPNTLSLPDDHGWMSTPVEPSRMEALLTRAPWARRLAYRLVHEAEAP